QHASRPAGTSRFRIEPACCPEPYRWHTEPGRRGEHGRSDRFKRPHFPSMKPFSTDRQRLPIKALSAPNVGDDVNTRLAGAAGGCSKRAESVAKPVAPQVEAIKQGDKVVRLVVTCSCGEKIEIDCLYPAGG